MQLTVQVAHKGHSCAKTLAERKYFPTLDMTLPIPTSTDHQRSKSENFDRFMSTVFPILIQLRVEIRQRIKKLRLPVNYQLHPQISDFNAVIIKSCDNEYTVIQYMKH